ncbi:MAG TPA: hypothetical protein PK836_04865 [Syntrophales bacterium]|nr:hypothetical protein [Syntrophales bacterium]HOM06145.1 hypothetical protein [Syntrophales bacterium]HON98991.1 hypothetical protein [Syntrophales bacterium]HPC00999.1 hypothetical protein [Syntrophales bacterium]HPQ05628.1 hypothetical protein [Syntrophales bacterium]
MDLVLMDCVKDLLRRVEELTGKEVRPVMKDGLPVPARMVLGDPADPFLNLLYLREPGEEIHFAVAVACGHILRIYEAPRKERFIPVATRRSMAQFLWECEEELNRLSHFFGREEMMRLIPLWYESAIYQLTTMPPEIMIHKRLFDHCPELRSHQLKSLERQRRDALRALSPEVRKITPARIYHAANIMNYVFFKLLEDHFHLDFVAAYHRTVFIFEGGTLASLSKRIGEDNHQGDRAMIDLWSTRLDLANWYEWRPLHDDPS